jgi:hypothetical protein
MGQADESPKPLSAEALLDQIDDLWRGRSSKGQYTMQIQTEHWQRTLTLQTYTLEKDYSLIFIKRPKKEEGTATLKVKNEIWNYLPKVDRVIKIPPSMLNAGWMGSHFTNDDLVKQSRLADDYTAEITYHGPRTGSYGNQIIYELTLIPKPSAPVVWGKIIAEVYASNLMPLVEYFYDERGKLARTVRFDGVKVMDGKKIPTRMEIALADKPKEFTIITTDAIDFDIALQETFFSLQRLTAAGAP